MKINLDITEYVLLRPVERGGVEVEVPPYMVSNFNSALRTLEKASELLESYYWEAHGGKKQETVAVRGVLVKVPPPSTEVKTT